MCSNLHFLPIPWFWFYFLHCGRCHTWPLVKSTVPLSIFGAVVLQCIFCQLCWVRCDRGWSMQGNSGQRYCISQIQTFSASYYPIIYAEYSLSWGFSKGTGIVTEICFFYSKFDEFPQVSCVCVTHWFGIIDIKNVCSCVSFLGFF